MRGEDSDESGEDSDEDAEFEDVPIPGVNRASGTSSDGGGDDDEGDDSDEDEDMPMPPAEEDKDPHDPDLNDAVSSELAYALLEPLKLTLGVRYSMVLN